MLGFKLNHDSKRDPSLLDEKQPRGSRGRLYAVSPVYVLYVFKSRGLIDGKLALIKIWRIAQSATGCS